MRRALVWTCGLACIALLGPAAASAYSWPVRPFNEAHAIRGYFSDPRHSGPEVGFHFGVDVVAADATPVYAIEGGRVRARGLTVSVFPLRRGGHKLSYWHVIPAVESRQLVRKHQLLGYVAAGAGHVHLAEYRNGTYVNPLRIGGLAPYIDDTVPRIPALTFYAFGRAIRPELVSGIVDVTVESYDVSPQPLPEEWAQARLSPALIRWRIVQGENTLRPWARAFDSRTFLLPFSFFDFVYAPATFQNRPNRPGHFEYYLAHELDTTSLPNGSYVLQVEALDTQENLAQASFAFTVTN